MDVGGFDWIGEGWNKERTTVGWKGGGRLKEDAFRPLATVKCSGIFLIGKTMTTFLILREEVVKYEFDKIFSPDGLNLLELAFSISLHRIHGIQCGLFYRLICAHKFANLIMFSYTSLSASSICQVTLSTFICCLPIPSTYRVRLMTPPPLIDFMFRIIVAVSSSPHNADSVDPCAEAKIATLSSDSDPNQKSSQAVIKLLPLMVGYFALSVPSGLQSILVRREPARKLVNKHILAQARLAEELELNYYSKIERGILLCSQLFTNNILSTAQQIWLQRLGGAKNPLKQFGDETKDGTSNILKSLSNMQIPTLIENEKSKSNIGSQTDSGAPPRGERLADPLERTFYLAVNVFVSTNFNFMHPQDIQCRFKQIKEAEAMRRKQREEARIRAEEKITMIEQESEAKVEGKKDDVPLLIWTAYLSCLKDDIIYVMTSQRGGRHNDDGKRDKGKGKTAPVLIKSSKSSHTLKSFSRNLAYLVRRNQKKCVYHRHLRTRNLLTRGIKQYKKMKLDHFSYVPAGLYPNGYVQDKPIWVPDFLFFSLAYIYRLTAHS
ncbi:hypothetical protein KSP40_PGU003120 [Platanthera guangdongensis]|uniref:Uncharacterized protein n=1 Tax=Platanthera guangdongensis TaxID=2320717 RepID=A0ABR2N269_9ASPA